MKEIYVRIITKLVGWVLVAIVVVPTVCFTIKKIEVQNELNDMRVHSWAKIREDLENLELIRFKLKRLCSARKTAGVLQELSGLSKTRQDILEDLSLMARSLEGLFESRKASEVLVAYYNSARNQQDLCSAPVLESNQSKLVYHQVSVPVFLKLYGIDIKANS